MGDVFVVCTLHQRLLEQLGSKSSEDILNSVQASANLTAWLSGMGTLYHVPSCAVVYCYRLWENWPPGAVNKLKQPWREL